MFERFSERARKVIVRAQEEARVLSHDHIGTEHLLLGLIDDEDSTSCQILTALSAPPDLVREAVTRSLGEVPPIDSPPTIPFSPRAKSALELALREALKLGHDYISTGHILLGLLRETDGKAAQVLAELSVSADAVRRKVQFGAVRTFGGTPRLSGDPLDVLEQLTSIERRLVAIEERLAGIETRLAEQE